ncbi:MAG TPA: DUF2849 domain-containing protein [Methyloceanibacter sp.]|jgi:hypothetical protein|nr:DUF2849 domain-containing protein [Methyloceanibacter sp.]
MPSVVTANRLVDGIVVYLAPDASWTEDLNRAWLGESEAEIQELETVADKAVKDRKVVAAYPMDVAVENGEVHALSVRERIRASHRTTLTKDWYDVPL